MIHHTKMAKQSTTWLQNETLYFDWYPPHRGWSAPVHHREELAAYYRLMELDNTVLTASDDTVRPHFYSFFVYFYSLY
jgi:hypothetical protein